jgi:hypothetical protein
LYKSVFVQWNFRKDFRKNFTVVMVPDQRMIRYSELLEYFTEILIGFRMSTIGKIAGDDTQFSVWMKLVYAGYTSLKPLAGIEAVQISSARH